MEDLDKFWMSLTHKKIKKSLSSACTLMFRKAFSISPTYTTGCSLNLISMSNIKGVRGDHTCRQSVSEVFEILYLWATVKCRSPGHVKCKSCHKTGSHLELYKWLRLQEQLAAICYIFHLYTVCKQ